MRELKFRFWGPFGEWGADNEYERKFVMLSGDEFAWEEYEPINDLFANAHHYGINIMQSTGLKDKDGQEIYGSDLVQDGEDFGVVEFSEKYGGWFIQWGEDCLEDESPLYDSLPITVIGNIYEHPELKP